MRAIVENPVVWLVLLGMAAAIVATFLTVLKRINRVAHHNNSDVPATEDHP